MASSYRPRNNVRASARTSVSSQGQSSTGPPPWARRQSLSASPSFSMAAGGGLGITMEGGVGVGTVAPIQMRVDGKREILTLYEKDTNMLEEAFNMRNSGHSMSTALDALCPYGGDAIAKVVYVDADTQWDTIMVSKNTNPRINKLRIAFEHALLSEGLILERETSAYDATATLIKLMVPFDRLCYEAERMKLKIPIQSSATSAKFAAQEGAAAAGTGGAKYANPDEMWKGMIDYMRTDSKKRQSLTFKKSKMSAFLGGNPDVFAPRDVHLGFFTAAQRNLLTYNIIVRCRCSAQGKERSKDFYGLLDEGVFSSVFPLHDGPAKLQGTGAQPNLRSRLYDKWRISIYHVPLDNLRDYYGERIALYFAFLRHFGRWLGIAAVVGVGVFSYGVVMAVQEGAITYTSPFSETKVRSALSTIFDNRLTMPFAFFLSVWGKSEFILQTVSDLRKLILCFLGYFSDIIPGVLEAPKYTFGMVVGDARFRKRGTDAPSMVTFTFQVTRQFLMENVTRYGTVMRPNHITLRPEPYFPRSNRRRIRAVTSIVLIIAILGVIASIAAFIVIAVYSRWYFDTYLPAYSTYAGLISASVSLATTLMLRPCLVKLAKVLTDMENHKTETRYQDALTYKNMIFAFLNTFGSLFYIAVLKVWIGRGQIKIMGRLEWQDRCLYDNCMLDLTIQMAVVFMGQGFLEHFRNFFLPFWKERRAKARKRRHESNPDLSDIENKAAVAPVKIRRFEEDGRLVPFNTEEGFSGGYSGTVVQFGFIVLFAVAFPLAPLFSIVHNALRMRIGHLHQAKTDAYNLLTKSRRPYAFQAADIGMWQRWLESVSYLAVLVNALTIAFASPYFERNYLYLLGTENGNPWAIRLAFILLFEHIVFGIKGLVAWWIPDIPRDVQQAIERQEFLDRGGHMDDEPEEYDADDLRRGRCCIL
ncbi:calcium-activated chloride channel-domain-containing protein [Phlyctochytrium arcticum]|nr:calcium-activated chloride channel-domain-containing protein [Phlyctochytrium arcticum]